MCKVQLLTDEIARFEGLLDFYVPCSDLIAEREDTPLQNVSMILELLGDPAMSSVRGKLAGQIQGYGLAGQAGIMES